MTKEQLAAMSITKRIWTLSKAQKEGNLYYEDKAIIKADWGSLLFSGNMRIMLVRNNFYIRANINDLTIKENTDESK